MILTLAKVPFIMSVVAFIWVALMLLLALVILIQKGKGGGLSGALGGMGAGTLLGTKTGDVLTWITIALVTGFLVLGILMSKFYRPESLKGLEDQTQQTQSAPVDTTEQETDGDTLADIAKEAQEKAETEAEKAADTADEAVDDAAKALEEKTEEVQQ